MIKKKKKKIQQINGNEGQLICTKYNSAKGEKENRANCIISANYFDPIPMCYL